MLKALFKKEVMRLVCSFGTRKQGKNSKNNQKKTPGKKGGMVFFIVIWGFVLFSIGMAFLGISQMFADILIPVGISWLYYAIIGLLGFIINIIGNAFTSSSILFKAKDNELLLSMPIPPSYILGSRMLVIFLMSVLFSCVPLIPAFCVEWLVAGSFSVSGLLILIAMIVLSSLLATAVSALFGWLLAAISRRIKRKSLATTAFTIIFLAAYYIFYFNVNKYLALLAENSLLIGQTVQSSGFAWPLYQFGLAAAGSIKSLIFFALLSIVLFAVVYILISKNLPKVLTASEKTLAKDFGEEEAAEQESIQQKSPRKAFLKKELSHFLSSPTYMVNCGLGLILMIASAVVLIIRGSYLTDLIASLPEIMPRLPIANALPVLCLSIVCILLSTCDITAPSISLEGKTLWIIKTLPADVMDIFAAKKNIQLYISAPPAIILLLVMGIVFKFDMYVIFLTIVAAVCFIELHASSSLMLGLIFPKLEWANEAVPIKQSVAVLIAFFVGPIICVGLAALYVFVLINKIEAMQFLVVLLVIFALGSRIMDKILRTKGVEMFNAL